MSMSDDEAQFDAGNAGSSYTYCVSAGSLKKGGYCMLKGHPCKISDVSTSKAGKHGHAKVYLSNYLRHPLLGKTYSLIKLMKIQLQHHTILKFQLFRRKSTLYWIFLVMAF